MSSKKELATEKRKVNAMLKLKQVLAGLKHKTFPSFAPCRL